MIGTPAFSAPTGVALCYFQFIFSPLHLQTIKCSARQSLSTQDEFYPFHWPLKVHGGHSKRLLILSMYFLARKGSISHPDS